MNGVLNAPQYDWSYTNSTTLTAGSMATLTLPTIPAGVTTGAVTIVSESSSSTTITRVSGDYFNTLWAGQSVNIDGTDRTISSCMFGVATPLPVI